MAGKLCQTDIQKERNNKNIELQTHIPSKHHLQDLGTRSIQQIKTTDKHKTCHEQSTVRLPERKRGHRCNPRLQHQALHSQIKDVISRRNHKNGITPKVQAYNAKISQGTLSPPRDDPNIHPYLCPRGVPYEGWELFRHRCLPRQGDRKNDKL